MIPNKKELNWSFGSVSSTTLFTLPEMEPKEGYILTGCNSLCLVYLPDRCTQDICVVTITDCMLHPRLEGNEVLLTPVVCITPHGMCFSSEKSAIIELMKTVEFNKHSASQKHKQELVPLFSSSLPLEWKELELQDCKLLDDRVVFKTTHFSYFAVIARFPLPLASVSVMPDDSHDSKPVELIVSELPGFKVEIPPTSVQSITEITATVYYDDPELYGNDDLHHTLATACVVLEPHGIQFANRIPITMPIPNYAKIIKEHPDIKLQLWCSPCPRDTDKEMQAKWEQVKGSDLEISCDSEGNYLATAYTTHFSVFTFLWNLVIDWPMNYFAERIHGRCQVFMSHETKFGSCIYFGIAVLLYPFQDPYRKLHNYDYILHDSGIPVELIMGDILCRLELNESLPLDSKNSCIQQSCRLSKEFSTRVDFSIVLLADGGLELPEGMVMGNLYIDEHIQHHKFNLIKVKYILQM